MLCWAWYNDNVCDHTGIIHNDNHAMIYEEIHHLSTLYLDLSVKTAKVDDMVK